MTIEYFVRRISSDFSNLVNKGLIEPLNTNIYSTLKLNKIDADIDDENQFLGGYVTIKLSADFELIGFVKSDDKLWERIFYNNNPAFFLVGYGANRRTERPEGYSEKSRTPRYQRVAGIFEDHVGLVPFTYGFSQLKENGDLDESITILNALLPDELSLTPNVDKQQRPLFLWNDTSLPFNALSDGYRSFIGWVWDLLYQLSVVQKDSLTKLTLTTTPGCVIVDEIDLLLHPEWQRIVVEQVARAFPKLQFLFSSHSPLVAGSLEPENIYITDGNTVTRPQEDIYGLTPNQILTSSYFGLASTRAPGTGTLVDLAKKQLGYAKDQASGEQADPKDNTLDPVERIENLKQETAEE